MAVIRANSVESSAQLCSDPSDCPVHNQLSLSNDPLSCLMACLKKKILYSVISRFLKWHKRATHSLKNSTKIRRNQTFMALDFKIAQHRLNIDTTTNLLIRFEFRTWHYWSHRLTNSLLTGINISTRLYKHSGGSVAPQAWKSCQVCWGL